MKLATACVVGAALAVFASIAYAETCGGSRVLSLELVKVTVDGVEESAEPDVMEAVGYEGGIIIGPTPDDILFEELSFYSGLPAPMNGAPCDSQGAHGHWPDVADLCAGRCVAGAWQVTGCKVP